MAVDRYEFSVVGMSCEHCRCRVQRALEEVEGVTSAAIDLETGTAHVETEVGATTRENLVAKVEEVGYAVGDLSTP